jgi:hypothetical protein
MKSCIVLFALAMTLAGCVSAQQLAAIDDQKCRSYGYTPDMPNYAQCRMMQDYSRQQASAIMAASLAQGMQNAQQAYTQPPPATQRPMRCQFAPGGSANTVDLSLPMTCRQ